MAICDIYEYEGFYQPSYCMRVFNNYLSTLDDEMKQVIVTESGNDDSLGQIKASVIVGKDLANTSSFLRFDWRTVVIPFRSIEMHNAKLHCNIDKAKSFEAIAYNLQNVMAKGIGDNNKRVYIFLTKRFDAVVFSISPNFIINHPDFIADRNLVLDYSDEATLVDHPFDYRIASYHIIDSQNNCNNIHSFDNTYWHSADKSMRHTEREEYVLAESFLKYLEQHSESNNNDFGSDKWQDFTSKL